MRKGFIMTSDALLAFLIISFSTLIINQLFNERPSYDRTYIHSIASDAAALIEDSKLTDTKDIVKAIPDNICLYALIQSYNGTVLVNEDSTSTPGCPNEIQAGNEDIVIARRTFINEYNNVIIVKGFYRRIE